MAHDNNGRIYIDTSVTPNVGISIRDIQTVLGSSKDKIGALITEVDENGKSLVNMWSRKKPVPWSRNNTPAWNPQGTQSQWWKGINNDFGIVSKSTDVTNLLSFIDGNMNGWAYNKDTLAYRFMDFDGYYHAAPNPFDSLFIQADRDAVAPSGTLTFQYSLRATGGEATTDSLGIIELYVPTPSAGGGSIVSNLYMGIVIYKKASDGTYSYYDWCSASETLADLEIDRAMHTISYTAPSELGEYCYVPVLTNVPKTLSAQAISDIITIPGASASDFVVSQTVEPYLQVDAFVYNTGTSENPNYNNTIYFICYFFGGSYGGNFNNISLGFQTGQGVEYQTVRNVQNRGSAGALSVAANTRVKLPAGSGDCYSITWTGGLTLESLVRELAGKAVIYNATSGTTMNSYTVPIRDAAALPGGSVIPF